MRILHIAPWASGRVFKQIIMQQQIGLDVTLCYGMAGDSELLGMVNKYFRWANNAAFAEMEFDIVVAHTTISTYKTVETMTFPKCNRLIWDCHDYVHNGMQDRFDMVVCPSMGMAKCFNQATVIYSKVPRCLVPVPTPAMLPRLDAVVLSATIGNGEVWSDYSGLSSRLGKHVFIYPANDNYEGHENEMILKRLPFTQMMQKLTNYRYGYAGAANDNTSIHKCVTNKFWEYIVAGCIVLLNRCEEMEKLTQTDEVRGANVYMESEGEKTLKAYGI